MTSGSVESVDALRLEASQRIRSLEECSVALMSKISDSSDRKTRMATRPTDDAILVGRSVVLLANGGMKCEAGDQNMSPWSRWKGNAREAFDYLPRKQPPQPRQAAAAGAL